MSDAAKSAGTGAQIWGGLMIFLGVLAIIAPFAAGAATALFVGVLLLLGGIAKAVGEVRSKTSGLGLLAAVVMAIAGVLLVAQPAEGAITLALVLAIYFLVEGVLEIAAAMQRSERAGLLWFSGIFSLLLALLIWSSWPLSGAWAVGVLVGVRLILAGWTAIATGSTVKALSPAA